MNIHRVYSFVFRIWRKRRFRLFLAALKPTAADKLLDVGGYPVFWTQHPPCAGEIDTLNVQPVEFDGSQFPNHNIRTLVGDGCAMSMANDSYDIVFSNSVIEHVGDWEHQLQFANEVRRLGRRLWVQTPAFECPLEPHYLAPFVHWLPISMRRLILRNFTPWGWMERPEQATVDRTIAFTRLLTRAQMKELFPDCRILTERVLGAIPKSYIAVRVPDEDDERPAAPGSPLAAAGHAAR